MDYDFTKILETLSKKTSGQKNDMTLSNLMSILPSIMKQGDITNKNNAPDIQKALFELFKEDS